MKEGQKISISKSKVFFVLSSCFLAGVFLASFFGIGKSFLWVLCALAIAIIAVDHRSKILWLLAGAAIFLAAGILRTNAGLSIARLSLSDSRTGPIELVGTIIREPETDETKQAVVIQAQERDGSNGLIYWWKKYLGVNGEKVLINADVYPQFAYGDELKVSCILQSPKNREGSNFDYQMYLAKDRIYRICLKPKIALLSKNTGNSAYSFVVGIKNKFENSLSAIFPDPEGAYLKGLLLGGSKRMPDYLANAFSRTGTTHTVAVSGYNVTIVAAFLMELGILIGLWRQQVFSFALLGIVFFVVATGSPASAVRAGIMGALVIWSMKEGRLANSENAILCAAAAMLAINPLLLRYDAGFQLSFLATLGIVYLSPIFEKIFERAGKVGIIKETIFLSVAAQIFVLPVILTNFENLSIISPLANMLILPAIPYIMFGGFVAGLAGFVFSPLGRLVGFVPYILLKAELWIVHWLANLPWVSVEIKNFGWRHILIYYVLLFGVLYFRKRKSRKNSPAY